jgi:hypothetical protein
VGYRMVASMQIAMGQNREALENLQRAVRLRDPTVRSRQAFDSRPIPAFLRSAARYGFCRRSASTIRRLACVSWCAPSFPITNFPAR